MCLDPNLLTSIKEGDLKMMMSIISTGIDLNESDKDGNGYFHICTKYKENGLKSAKLLYESGCDDIEKQNSIGWTCLHSAAAINNLEILKFYVDIGGKRLIRIFAGDGQSALHFSIVKSIEAITYLLDNGANLFQKDIFKRTPLDRAKSAEKKDILEKLKNYKKKKTKVWREQKKNHIK